MTLKGKKGLSEPKGTPVSIIQVCGPLRSVVVDKLVSGPGYPRCHAGWCTTEVSLESSELQLSVSLAFFILPL